MFNVLDKAIVGMSILRFISGFLEILVALAILKINDLPKALILNSSLALIGPCVLILTTAIGVMGMAEKLSVTRILVIFCGVGFILLGARMK